MSYLETGVLVEADDSEDDKARSHRERKSDHGELAIVSCEDHPTMAIDVGRKRASMNSHSRASHFRLQHCMYGLSAFKNKPIVRQWSRLKYKIAWLATLCPEGLPWQKYRSGIAKKAKCKTR